MHHNIKCSVPLDVEYAEDYMNTPDVRRDNQWALAVEARYLEAKMKIDGRLIKMKAPFIIIATFVEKTDEFRITHTTSLS